MEIREVLLHLLGELTHSHMLELPLSFPLFPFSFHNMQTNFAPDLPSSRRPCESLLILYAHVTVLHFISSCCTSNIRVKRLEFSFTLFELALGKHQHSQFTSKKTTLILIHDPRSFLQWCLTKILKRVCKIDNETIMKNQHKRRQ